MITINNKTWATSTPGYFPSYKVETNWWHRNGHPDRYYDLHEYAFIKYDYYYNSLGFRDDEFDMSKDEPISICLGDSYVEGKGSPRECTWPSIVQKLLGHRTLNLGVPCVPNSMLFELIKHFIENYNVQNCFVQFASPLSIENDIVLNGRLITAGKLNSQGEGMSTASIAQEFNTQLNQCINLTKQHNINFKYTLHHNENWHLKSLSKVDFAKMHDIDLSVSYTYGKQIEQREIVDWEYDHIAKHNPELNWVNFSDFTAMLKSNQLHLLGDKQLSALKNENYLVDNNLMLDVINSYARDGLHFGRKTNIEIAEKFTGKPYIIQMAA